MDKHTAELLELAETTLNKCSHILCESFESNDYAVGCGKLADGVACLINAELHRDVPKASGSG